jgi:hypothetical protein
MDSTHIDKVLRKVGKDTFYGVYPCDQLPKITRLPALLVVNTDPAHRGGQHWIAMYINVDRTGELFDSLAETPPKKEFLEYMNNNCDRWTSSVKQLQSAVSSFCGNYVVVYSILRLRGLSLRNIEKQFSSDTGLNDYIVHRYACQRLMF